MLASLKLIFQRLIEEVPMVQHRSLYHSVDLTNRLIGLVGARGVGKTTLLLQLIVENFPDRKNVFYFSADHIYFETNKLYDLIEDLYLTDGIENFFIDEIHKYPNWNQELKNLYDGFPKIKIIFSGSSSLDLIHGSHDLSRRAKMYHLPGMSFREYLNFNLNKGYPVIPFAKFMQNHQALDATIAAIPKIKGHFQQYLSHGFYPFYFENPLSYHERILNIIDKTIYEDIASFYNLRTSGLHYFKKILAFLASIPPGTTSVHNIAKNLMIDDKTALYYLEILTTTGLINSLYPSESGNLGLRRPEKVFLNNTNLHFVLEGNLSPKSEIGTIRELFFVQSLKNAGLQVTHSKQGDFKTGNFIFEIGGKNKTKAQIKGMKEAFLVKDDILTSSKHEIPLLYFGFLY